MFYCDCISVSDVRFAQKQKPSDSRWHFDRNSFFLVASGALGFAGRFLTGLHAPKDGMWTVRTSIARLAWLVAAALLRSRL